ncbi:MAG: TonB-dependent receptor domain-containing protein [Myxococcota bacterium]
MALLLSQGVPQHVAVVASDPDWLGEDPRDEDVPLETTVSGARTKAMQDVASVAAGGPARRTPYPEDVLEGLGGVILLRDGGPLAPARVQYRGLGGPRLDLRLAGIPLNDPTTATIDVAALPIYAIHLLRTDHSLDVPGASGLELTLAAHDETRLALGAGTLETLRADAASSRTDQGRRSVVGVSAASTRGNFMFVPTTSSGASLPVTRRASNDQRRASGVLALDLPLAPGPAGLVAWTSLHEGGVPGFATMPTDGLRASELRAGAIARGALGWGDGRLGVEVGGRATRRATSNAVDAPDDALTGIAFGPSVISSASLDGGISLQGTLRYEHSRVDDNVFVRDLVRGRGELHYAPTGKPYGLHLAVGAIVPSDNTVLPLGELRAQYRAAKGALVELGASRSGRLPTLEELYAPKGFVLGNPALRSEVSTDVEASLSLAGPLTRFRFNAFAGQMDDTILYVNRNAFEVEPVNTGALWRTGFDMNMVATPVPLLGIEVTGSALLSRLNDIDTPLPVTPPLSTRVALRLGEAMGANLHVVLRQRAAVSNNLYGTLRTPGYGLVDLVSRIPLGVHLSVSAAVTNAFDVLDARDVNLLPLPGRQVFFTVESHT